MPWKAHLSWKAEGGGGEGHPKVDVRKEWEKRLGEGASRNKKGNQESRGLSDLVSAAWAE